MYEADVNDCQGFYASWLQCVCRSLSSPANAWSATVPADATHPAGLASVLEAACAAHAKVNHLINELEANDVAWQGLGIFRAPWLGERTANLIREAREAGYVR